MPKTRKFTKLTRVLIFLIFSIPFTSSDGLDYVALIKQHEGFRADVYLDLLGYPTIGYGHLIKEGEIFNNSISEEQATVLLKEDFYAAIMCARRIHKDTLTHDQLLAIGHLIYSIGVGNYSRSNLLKALKQNKSKQQVFNEWVGWAYKKSKLNLRALRSRTLEYYTYVQKGEKNNNEIANR